MCLFTLVRSGQWEQSEYVFVKEVELLLFGSVTQQKRNMQDIYFLQKYQKTYKSFTDKRIQKFYEDQLSNNNKLV